MRLESVSVECSGHCPGCGFENYAKVPAHVTPGQPATVVAAVTCGNADCRTVFQVTGTY